MFYILSEIDVEIKYGFMPLQGFNKVDQRAVKMRWVKGSPLCIVGMRQIAAKAVGEGLTDV
jgi:hypothetical protein